MSQEQAERVRAILYGAAEQLAAIDEINGMPTAVVMAYLLMDENGETWDGDAFEGSITTAIGLCEQFKHSLIKFKNDS